jgi:hypothetical protein
MAKAGAFLRMGLVEGRGKGREVDVAPSQYFHIRGGHFVKMSAAANGASLCASGDTTVAGWLITPKQAAGKSAYLSVSGDTGFLVNGYEDVFAIRPSEAFASMAASWVGKAMAIVNSGATYGIIQKAKYGPGAATPLACVDVDVDNKILYVRIKSHQPS